MALTLPLSDQKQMSALVDRRHPDFDRNLNHWKFCSSSYEGGRDWFEKNIHRYLKEGDTEFEDRKARAYRFNHTREVVNLVTKYIFRDGIIRNTEDAPDSLKEFWKNASLDGAPIDVLMRRVSDWSSVNGRVWVVVDSKGGEVTTLADEKSGNARTYAYIIHQDNVLDFSLDEWGKLIWILYRYPYRDDENPVTSSGKVLTRYMLWTRDEWFVLEERQKEKKAKAAVTNATVRGDKGKNREIVLINSGFNPLGEVPMIAADHLENEDTYGPPGLIDDIAYLDRAVANYLSNLDAIIQDQTFSQLAMPAQGLMPGEEDYDKMREMGTKRIFLYDGESNKGPEYLTPDAAQAGVLLDVVKTIIGEIYHSIGMAGERTKQDNAMGIDNSSGVAKAYDFDRMNALLAAKADMLQRTEEKIAYLVQRWAGDIEKVAFNAPAESENVESLIKYPDSYDTRGLPDEFDIAQNLALLDAPDTVRREQLNILIQKLFPRLASDLKEDMEKEIEKWPMDENDMVSESLSTVETFGNVIGKVAKQVNGQSQVAGPKLAGPKPAGKSKQGQNPGKPKVVKPKSK